MLAGVQLALKRPAFRVTAVNGSPCSVRLIPEWFLVCFINGHGNPLEGINSMPRLEREVIEEYVAANKERYLHIAKLAYGFGRCGLG